jgi:uncharacterized protein YegJ (DUF2314 family)
MKRSSSLLRAAALALLAGCFLLSSCSPSLEPVPIRDVSFSDPVDLGDAELNQAAAKARASFPQFLTALNDPGPLGTRSYFMVKIRVKEANPPATEDISVSAIKPDEKGGYSGEVENAPATLKSVNMTDLVHFVPNQIVEWQYVEKEKIVGAQVTRVRRARMSEADRKAFDASYDPPFPFE